MNYTKKDLGSFRLHLIRTNKFKTVTMKVLFHTPITKEDITKRILLSDILLQSSKKYESKRSMTIEAEELYSATLSTGNQRLGNYIFTNFNLQVLNDKYTEEGNLEKAVEFLSEIIFHPNINNGGIRIEIIYQWSPAFNLNVIITHVLSIISIPDFDDPLVDDIAFLHKKNINSK